MNRNDLISFISSVTGHENVIAVPRVFVELTGDWGVAAMLNQLIYWSSKSKRSDGYIYKSVAEWEGEVGGITKYTVEKLKDLPFVETKLMKANGAPTTHYKVDFDKLIDAICEKQKVDLLKTENGIAENSNSLTETTTETTKELKHSEYSYSLDWDALAKESKEKSDNYIKGLKERNPNPFSRKEKLDGVLDNIYDYPPDVQETIKSFCKRWKMPPPPKSSKSFSKWIRDGRELMKMSSNTQLSVDDILDETYYVWKTPPPNIDIPRGLFGGRFTVKDIGSINNMAWVSAGNLLGGKTSRRTKIYYDADGKEIRVDE